MSGFKYSALVFMGAALWGIEALFINPLADGGLTPLQISFLGASLAFIVVQKAVGAEGQPSGSRPSGFKRAGSGCCLQHALLLDHHSQPGFRGGDAGIYISRIRDDSLARHL